MGDGRAQEFAPPAELLADPSSLFSQLVDSVGDEEAAELRELATAGRGFRET